MRFRSRRRVNKAKRVFIKVMHKLGIPVGDIVRMSGVSRATIYRHIKR